LNWILYTMGSQCSSFRADCTWSRRNNPRLTLYGPTTVRITLTYPRAMYEMSENERALHYAY